MRQQHREIEAWRCAFRALSADATGQETCPDPGRIWAATDGELTPAEIGPFVDHLAACPACAEAWRIASTLRRDEAPVTVVEGPWQRRFWVAASAAAALLLVSLGLYFYDPVVAPGAKPVYREAQPALADEIQSQLDEGATLPREDFVLRWRGPEDAVYDIVVSTLSAEVLAEARDLEQPEYRVPPKALAALHAGDVVTWQVEGVRSDGTPVASKTFISKIK